MVRGTFERENHASAKGPGLDENLSLDVTRQVVWSNALLSLLTPGPSTNVLVGAPGADVIRFVH